jgi:glycine/D-amino acid oxidase-like deaminating enzyme
MRVAVIGSGVVGSSVAWHLGRRGADVVMIDAGEPGIGVTNWTFSWVNASSKTQTPEYFALNRAGLLAYGDLVEELGAHECWHPTGHLRWHDDPAMIRMQREEIGLLRSWGYDAVLWDARRVRRELEANVHFPADDTEVAFCPEEGWLDGRGLAGRLVEDAVRLGRRPASGAP